MPKNVVDFISLNVILQQGWNNMNRLYAAIRNPYDME